jgi:DNA-binding MarR family transcriptional regulator
MAPLAGAVAGSAGSRDGRTAVQTARAMSHADRDLVSAIRAELAAVSPQRACDRAAESAGLGTSLATREASVARLAVRLGREPTEAGRLLTGPRRTKHFRVSEAELPPTAFEWSAAHDHCRIAYLRGRFLARGSLSLASGRAHLEFVVPPEEAPVLATRLDALGLPASWRIRRGRGVVTWKSAEAIGTFLRRIGAGAAILELETRQVTRALRGDINRVINAESANLQRAVAAASRQLAAVDLLEADGRLAVQPHVVRVVAAARRETPEATFTELAERLDLHRSAVQRAFERLERLVLQEDEAIGMADRRTGGRRSLAQQTPASRRRARPAEGPALA